MNAGIKSFNIFIIIFIICLLCIINQYGVLLIHGYIYPWFDLHWKLPAQIYETLINNILPVLFNQNPNDFRSGFGVGSILLASLYSVICFLFTRGFFLSCDYREKTIYKKIFSLIFILSLLILYINFYHTDSFYASIFRFNDLATSAEYFFILIPYLIFIFAFTDIIYRNHKPNKLLICIYILISYIIGYYNELANISILAFLIIFLILTFIFDKNKLKNKYILCLIIPFFISFFHYYVISNKFLSDIGSYNSSFIYSVKFLQNHYIDALQKFIDIMFIKKIVFYILITIISGVMLKFKTKNYNYILIFIFSILAGYIFANFCTLFTSGIDPNEDYMFMRPFWDLLYVNILEFCILVLLGSLYNNYKFIKWIIALFLLFFICFFPSQYTSRQNALYEIKKLVYITDKYNLIYTVLGESAVLPKKYLAVDAVKNSEIFKIGNEFQKERLKENQYINAEYFHYKNYFDKIYKQKYIGAIFKSDDFAQQEFQKRLILFDDKLENDNELRKNNISFKSMYKKYKGLKLTLDDIQKMELKHGKSLITDKAKAFIYYENKNYDKSIKLYKRYLSKYPDDIDSLLHIADIECFYKHYKKAEEIYKKLIRLDKNNLLFLYKLEKFYYNDIKNYPKAEKINQLMINSNPQLCTPYLDGAMIYSAMNKKDKSQKYINIAIEKNAFFIKEDWLQYNNLEKPYNYEIQYPYI